MAQIFRIATASKAGDFHLVGDKAKVSPELFWQTVRSKVKDITAKQPEKYDEVMKTVEGALFNSSLTILDTWFEIKGKP